MAHDAEPRDDAPHLGPSLSAQARYAAGVREILECWLDGRPIREEYLIVAGGGLAGAGALLQRGRRHGQLRQGGALQERLTAAEGLAV